jgi:hypothetical protein
MTETLLVNGISLDTRSVMLTDISGLSTTPGRRGENILVPGRHGRIPTRAKRYDQGEAVLSLWIDGCNPDGTIPGGSNALREFEKRRDEVIRVFHSDTVVIDYTPDSGLTRRALCEIADVMDFTRRGVEPLARVSVALTIPGAFWFEIFDQTHTASLATGMSTVATPFAGATAPMDELVITFGPGNNPELGQGDVFLAYDGVIAGGRTLVVNTSTWQATGTGGLVVDYSKLRHGGSPRWFEIAPEDPAPTLQLSHSGGGSMSVTITGKRRFLTG